MIAPILIFACGNPSRGDDALGPEFLRRLPGLIGTRSDVELQTDFQLQVEHALDLQGRERVLFVDAAASGPAPFVATRLQAQADASVTTHALSPAAVLATYRLVNGAEPPPCLLLAVRGYEFELGAPLSDAAARNLEAALAWCRSWLARGCRDEVEELPPSVGAGPDDVRWSV